MNIWQKAIRAIKGTTLTKSVMNVYPYMDNAGQIWIHIYPTHKTSPAELQSLLAEKQIKSTEFTGPHNVSNVSSISANKQQKTFNKFMTESEIMGATRPIGTETCVRVSMAEYLKNKDIIDSLKGAESLSNGIKSAEILHLETGIQEGFSATSPKHGFVYYIVPKKGKKLADLQQEFAKHNIPVFEYETSLSPEPVLAIRAGDLDKLGEKVAGLFLNMLDRIDKRNRQSKAYTIHNMANQHQK